MLGETRPGETGRVLLGETTPGETGRILVGDAVRDDGTRGREGVGRDVGPKLRRRAMDEERERGEAAGSCSMNSYGTRLPAGEGCASIARREGGRVRDCERERPPTGTGMPLPAGVPRTAAPFRLSERLGVPYDEGVALRHGTGDDILVEGPVLCCAQLGGPPVLADMLERGRGSELRAARPN